MMDTPPCAKPGLWRGCAPQRDGGFTLFETILVVAVLTMVSLGIMAIQPRVFATQNNGRDQYVGMEIMRACAERLLAVRRGVGYGNVTNTLCNGMGGVGGFNANPTVELRNGGATGSVVSACTGTLCTATVTVAKTSGPAASVTPLTLQLSFY